MPQASRSKRSTIRDENHALLIITKNNSLNFISVIGIVAGIFTSASSLPQLIKIVKEKKVEDLSIGMFTTLVAGVILWMVYGVLRSDFPIIITNAFSVLLNIFILIAWFRYKNT